MTDIQKKQMKRWTLEEVERYAAQKGIAFTTSDTERITTAQENELERQTRINPIQKSGWIDRWNDIYPRFLEALVNIGDVLMTITQTIFVSIGVPVVLVLLLIVEHQRVLHGIALFEVDYNLASFAAFSLVILNLVLEFQVHHIEHREGYTQELGNRWSLRLWWKQQAYRLGIGDEWQPQALSPAQRYRSLLRLVTFTILALALAGSMRTVIEVQPGAWYQAIGSIITDSSLLDLTIWMGGLLFAAAAVLSAQGLSRYVAIRVVEISHQKTSERDNPYQSEVDYAGAMVALAIVNKKLERKEAKKQKENTIEDHRNFTEPVMIQNGNGSHG